MAGLLWAHAGIALELLVLPGYLSLSDGIAYGWWYRLAHWTLLAPFALATQFAAVGMGSSANTDSSLAALLLCPVLGVGLCLSVNRVLGMANWRRAAIVCMAGVGVLGVVCAAAVALQFHDVAVAEKSYFAMVSRVDTAHKDAATVLAAREFSKRHPDSRWAGEALRIVAMAEWDAGRFEAASQQWSRFESRFRDRSAPGVAYAEYSIALCDERLGRDSEARRHLRAAIETIRARGDGIQGWIATEAAARMSVHERSVGRYALAGYWKTKSRTFSDVYSTE